MSHLFKAKNKLLYKYFKIIIFLTLIILFYYGYINFVGSKFLYIFFSFVSNFLIFFAFRKNAIFFETFFSLLLWLGFWFKLTCTLIFTDGIFREGVGLFDYTSKSYNDTLIVCIVGIAAFIFAGYFREIFLFNYPKKLTFINFKNNFFINRQKTIWTLFIVFFLLVSFFNFYFKIYQKGLLPIYDLNFLISGIFKWLLIFGLSAISSILIFYEFNYYKKFFFISSFIIFLETFITSLSLLSRGMIFNSTALLFGIYKLSKKTNKVNNIKYYLKFLSLILFLFYISASSVNYIRSNFYYIGKSSKYINDNSIKIAADNKVNNLSSSVNKINSEMLYLLINRWVGIDGVMAVTSKKGLLSFDFFNNSLKEKASPNTPTFYESNFNLDSVNMSNATNKYKHVKGNTLPGIFAYLYYSGSNYFLFLSVFAIVLFGSYIEYVSFKLSSKNIIFSALIGQVVAFRLIHFGYLPSQSYLLFGSIILSIFLVYILNLYLTSKGT